MFAYVTTHLVNHSLGLISVRVMDLALEYIYEYWASPLGGAILYGAFAIHYSLALWALWLRRSLKMPFAEATQLVLGFSIPFMLTDHVLQTRVADKFFGANYGYYSTLLYAYFVANPPRGVVQLVVLLVAWIHAMIGLRFWLRLKPWYERWQPILYAFALLLPTFAILGVFEGGRQIMILAEDPAWVARLVEEHPRPAGADAAFLERMVVGLRFGFLAALLAVLAARIARSRWERRRGVIRMTYPSGRVVEILHGVSALEASRMAGIPHASVCGGRGRCSTCRIKVEGPVEALPPPAADEVKVLHRVGAAPDVRLACQLRPQGDLRVTPLLPATAQASDGFRRPGYLHGAEREIAILFADLRAFTQLSEHKLPYDLVFLLNRYFAEMGHAVEAAGGRIDKFIGDGVMALFGLDTRRRGRLPRGARRRQGHVRAHAEPQCGAGPRPRRAAADRHRHPYRPRHRGRDGLRQGGLDHGGRRFRQHREPHRGPHQDLCLRARDLRGGGAARRPRSRRRPPPRDRDPRPGRAPRGAHVCERAGSAGVGAGRAEEGVGRADAAACHRNFVGL